MNFIIETIKFSPIFMLDVYKRQLVTCTYNGKQRLVVRGELEQ